MDHVEFMAVRLEIHESIVLDESERIPGLMLIVYTDDLIESSTVITHRGPASPTE